MARASLILDVRESSRNVDGLYPIALRIFHKKQRIIRLTESTSKAGWNEKRMILKKSVLANQDKDCDSINKNLYDKLHLARSIINELGDTINAINVDTLVEHIKKAWDKELKSDLKTNLSNEISLSEWGQVLINRKLKEAKPSTAKWYKDSIAAFTKINNQESLKLYQITVTLLKEFELEHRSKGNSNNAISAYIRAIRAIYNSAMREDKYIPIQKSFSKL